MYSQILMPYSLLGASNRNGMGFWSLTLWCYSLLGETNNKTSNQKWKASPSTIYIENLLSRRFQTNKGDKVFHKLFWTSLKISFSSMPFRKSTKKETKHSFLLKQQTTKPTKRTLIHWDATFLKKEKKKNAMLFSSSARHSAVFQYTKLVSTSKFSYNAPLLLFLPSSNIDKCFSVRSGFTSYFHHI